MKAKRGFMLCMLFAVLCVTGAQGADQIEAAKLYPSLASQLTDLYLEMQREPGALAQLALAHPDLRVSPDGSVLVWVMQVPGTPARTVDTAALARLGGRIAGMSEHFLEAWIPIDMLPRVADEVAGVTFLRPPIEWQQDVYTSEGVALMGVDVYHDVGLRGAGAKVAVVDLSFDGYTAAQSAGELPANAIIQNLSSGPMENGSVHGTACAEIVYDMVPEAQLYLICVDATLLSSTENAVDYCISEGIDVMSWSLGTVSANFLDGLGPICDIVNNAFAHDLLPVASMGNYAGNAGDAHFEGTTVDENSDLWVEFATADDAMAFNARAGTPVQVWLNWNGWPVTSQDYDLYIYNGPTSEVWHSNSPQTGSQPPIEGGTFDPPADGTYYLRVKRHSSATPTGVKYEIYMRGLNGGLEYSSPQSSLSSPADATGAVAVGAIDRRKWTTGPQEAYSSQGPTNDGRVKPEVCGPDYVSTYSFRPGYFIGTSAATPHVAGAAALIKSVHPTWTAAQVREELVRRTVDMGDAGADNIYGYGRLVLPPYSITITAASADPAEVPSGGTTQLSAAAEDSLGHTTFTWSWSDNGAGGTFAPGAAAQNPTWTAPGNTGPDPVAHHLTLTVTSTEVPSASELADVYVTEEVAVHTLTVAATANPTAVVSGGSSALSAQATDTFGHAIASYSWSDGDAGGSFSPGAAVQSPTYTAPENDGLADVTVTLSVAVVCDGAEPLSATDAVTLVVHPHYDFPDVPYDHWAFAQVEACYRQAIVGGYPDGTYRPAVEVTRDQMAVYIARAVAGGDASVLTGPAEPSFTDVPTDHWAYRYVEYAQAQGIVQGYPDGSYQPDTVVTRDQMAVYIARAIVTPIGDANVPDPDPGAEPSFTDVAADHWAYKYIEYCAAQGVVQGYSNGTYRPANPVTRDQMAVYVARGFELLPM
jgi:subtilisin family serine protease